MTLSISLISQLVEMTLQRNTNEEVIRYMTGTVTRFLNDGGSIEINGSVAQNAPIRVHDMVRSQGIDIPIGRSTHVLPPDFGAAKSIEGPCEFNQAPISEIAQKDHLLSTYVTDYEFHYNKPLICYEGGELHVFSLTPMQATLHYWQTLPDPFDPGNWVSNYAPDIYEAGITALMAERVQDDEKKVEQWAGFTGSIDELNKSKSDNAVQFAPPRVRFRPPGRSRVI